MGDDEALMSRVRTSGDENAFRELTARYRARVTGLARRVLSASFGSDEADDVAQEAFVEVYHKRATYRRGEPFRPWLYRIAINRCLDRCRARARRPTEPLETAAEQISSADPARDVLRSELEARLDAAVAALPPALRAVFILRHGEELSYDEIAVAMNLPLGTIKTHLFRARAALRAALTGYFDS
jgi:RNA polymerase sigma-70 factor (ECF subfamily)